MRSLLLLLLLLSITTLGHAAGGLNYPGGITTNSQSGCVRYDASTNPRAFYSTGMNCHTANALQTKTYAALSAIAAPTNGDTYYCSDCTEATPCAGSGTGAFAQRIAGTWKCASGGGGGTECSTAPCDLDTATTLNGQALCLEDGTNCPPAASSAFSGLTSGTNTTAAMVVGSGASLSPSGSGTINANEVTCSSGCISSTEIVDGTIALADMAPAGNTSQVLHGNGVGAPSYGPVVIGNGTTVNNDVKGTLPIANGGTNQTAFTTNRCVRFDGTSLVTASGDCASGDTTFTPVEGTAIDVSGSTISFDPTEMAAGTSEVTWGAEADAPVTWIWDTSSDVALTFGTKTITAKPNPDTGDLTFSVSGDLLATTATASTVNASSLAYLNTGATLQFEGSAPDTNETTLTVANPTADRTITLPNASGTVPLLESNNVFTGTMDVVPGSATRLQVNALGATLTDYSISKGVIFDNSTGVLQKTGTGSLKADDVACTGCVNTTDILNGTVAVGDLASADFGSFTCNGTTCAVDTGAIGPTEIAATAVSAGSYTNANITVDADGRLTAASSGASIPAAFALNVDKSGTDGASCGPINAPCLTITGTNGAFAKIRTNNDNGFATCSLDNSLGCGRCSTTTSTQCNENADCPGGETCTATNSVCSGLSKGTCTGPTKFYQVNVGAGEFNEYMAKICVGGADDGKACNESGTTCSGGTCTDNAPPSPGYVLINITPRTTIYHGADCILEYTNRSYVTFNGNGEQPGGGGGLISWSGRLNSAAWCTYGNGHGNAINGATLAHLGLGWDWRQIGTGNSTNGIHNTIMGGIGSGASANGAYIESYAATCSNDATRGCIANGDCSGGTCTVSGSSDWSISNSFLQYGDAKGGTVINVVGKGCGSAFNQFLQGLTAHIGGGASYCAGGSNSGALCTVNSQCPSSTCANESVTFLKTERGNCHASSNAIVAATGLDVIVKDVKIRGIESDVSGFTQPDVTANIGANTTMESNGTQSWDHCKRTIGGTLVYASSDQKYAGGMTELGPLACTAPPNPVNGECWYDLTTNTRKCQRNSATLTAAFTRTHATDCTNNVTDGKKGDLCTDEDDGRTWVCIPTFGDCNTTAEWLPVGKQSTMAEDISADTASFAAATTDYTMASLAQWANSTGGTLLLFAGDFVTGGAGAKTFTCLMRNNGSTITGSTFSATADNNSPAHAIVSYSIFTQATINGTVDVRCQVDSGTTATVSAVSFRRITFDAPLIAYGSGVPTWLATPSSANLASALTDETGSGAAVFGTAPTITTPTLTLENGSSPPTAANRVYKDTTKKRVTIADGTTANPIGLFFPETGIGYNTFSTTKTYQTAFGSPGGNLACFTTESTRQGMVAGNISCDALSVCGDVTLAASEKVTITLRVDTNADGTGADTTLTCDVDGDAASSNCDGTSTKKGCRVTLSTPVEITKDTLVSYGAVCAGAGCPTGNENFQAQLRCWPTQ